MKKIKNIIFFTAFAAIFASCATQVMPDGGPRDTSPPEVKEMNPPKATTNFDAEKIEIEFDEFVVLDDINNQLLISPLMREKPDISIKGKKVIIKLPDTLKPNTTYSFFFGEGVKNYKENIAAENLNYVFSTGENIDSLFIKGTLKNSFDNTPVSEAYVMLYRENYDSVVAQQLPDYITKVDENGNFEIKNIANDKYKIFAIKDMNSNYLFDQPTEEIAFLDSLLYSTEKIISKKYDTIQKDTIIKKALRYPEVELSMFMPSPDKQLIMSDKVIAATHLQFVFKLPVEDFELKGIYPENIKPEYLNFGKNKDSLNVYFKPETDSIIIELIDNKVVLDTFTYVFNKVDQNKPIKNITNNFSKNLRFYRMAKLKLNDPIKTINKDLFSMQVLNDTVFEEVDYDIILNKPKGEIVFNAEYDQSKRYRISVIEGGITDFYGRKNDSLKYEFATTSKKTYGTLTLTFTNKNNTNVVLQLLKNGEDLVREFVLEGDKEIDFGYLDAGKYQIKVIIDENKNGKWDGGDYYQNIYPEKVIFFQKQIDIKANWDNFEDWEFDY